ncbi:Gpi-c transferase complex [Coleophoma cylindrospora]|uniref:Gpi-c transferase complex n=1 Tax=Coleophoma cylindrospora TaxID=1849047 RepID=A0A3D8QSV8_9HELO|nr:Gpi-c transferase complex [Coleophoma cylindrospora]
MLTTQPRLRARRPSPTTVEYTVSTTPTPTIALRLLFGLTILLRLTLGIAALLLLYSKWALSPLATPIAESTTASAPALFTNEFIWYTVHHIHCSPLGELATQLAERTPLILLLPSALGVLYAIFLRMHTTESLLVLRGLGIQTSTSANTYLSTATTRFIPTEKIQDIFVNEAFKGFEVRYYLVVVVEGEEDVVVVFPSLLPRRQIVETVWRGVRGCLYEPEMSGKR